jgi:hypothetical protein
MDLQLKVFRQTLKLLFGRIRLRAEINVLN